MFGNFLDKIWIWQKFGLNTVDIWIKFGQNLDFGVIWTIFGQNMDFTGGPTLNTSAHFFNPPTIQISASQLGFRGIPS